jgi:formylmethanofuran dehydrogenase subunit D
VETAGNWRKSSYSGADGGECVEVATASGVVLVRDTKNRNGGMLIVPASMWSAFVATVK